MKTIKLLFSILPVFLFASCTEEDPEVKSTFTFKYQAPDMTGITSTVTLYEYNATGERIQSHAVENCQNGDVEQFTANDNTVKVKAFILLQNTSTSYSSSKWIQQVYYLESGKNIDIILSSGTLTGNNEP